MKKMFILVLSLALSFTALAAIEHEEKKEQSFISPEELLLENFNNRIKVYDLQGNLVKSMRSEDEDKELIRKSDFILDDGKDKIFIVYTR